MVDYLPTCQVSLNYEGPLNIGIVGRISEHKGASIIRQMAHIIQKRHLPATITIIGELEGASIPSVIKTTGLYKREELPKLIENSGVNVFFLPSIWPETFSYVAEELIQLNVPLAVFELGAPAERVASYVNGMIIREVDAEHVVEQLMAFHSRLRKSFSELD